MDAEIWKETVESVRENTVAIYEDEGFVSAYYLLFNEKRKSYAVLPFPSPDGRFDLSDWVGIIGGMAAIFEADAYIFVASGDVIPIPEEDSELAEKIRTGRFDEIPPDDKEAKVMLIAHVRGERPVGYIANAKYPIGGGNKLGKFETQDSVATLLILEGW